MAEDGIRIIALLLVIGGPVLLAIIVLMNRHSLARKKYDKINQALESGRSPEDIERMIDIMDKVKTPCQRTGFFRTGFVVIGFSFASLVVGLVLGIKACLAAAGAGLVFGLMLIAVWFLMDHTPGTS